MTKLKSLLRLIDGNTTVSIKYRWTSTQCDSDEGCQQPDEIEWFNGYAEDVPFKLMETTVIAVDAYIQNLGKNGRKKHGTRAVIEILVKENDD